MLAKSILMTVMLTLAAPVAAHEQEHEAQGEYEQGCRHGPGQHRHGHEGGHGQPRHEGCGHSCGQHTAWDIPEAQARAVNPVEASAQSMARGRSLYQDNCRRCHGEYGFGDGPDAAGLGVRPAMLRHAARHHSDGKLSYMIRKGRDPMPAWQDKLSQDELWDLINYLRFEIGARRGPPEGRRRENCEHRAGQTGRDPGRHTPWCDERDRQG
jgi:mono/diheme cytochrome c family protein